MRFSFLAMALLLCSGALAQERVRGRVVSDSAGIQKGIPGVGIYVPLTRQLSITDSAGYFTFLATVYGHMELVARFSPVDSSIFMYHPPHVTFPVLVKSVAEIREIQIRAAKAASSIAAKGIRKIEILNEGEFKKAACCTLGESFETTNSVEVSNSDGVSGIRHVEMLGLAGKYVWITRNNMPLLRGFALLNGLNQVPGPMVGSVNIAKGTGSVAGSYEGITGGIDYALKTERTDPVVFANVYANNQQRYEGNAIVKSILAKNLYNHAYLHYGQQQHFTDRGGDGMTDMPKYQRIFLGDQLNFSFKKAEGMLGGSYTSENRKGGSVHAFHGTSLTPQFLFDHQENKTELWGKLGIFLNQDGSKSIGNIITATQNQSSANLMNLNKRSWEGNQKSIAYTGMYGSPEDNPISIRTGLNITYDQVSEKYRDSGQIKYQPVRKELNAGLFAEWVFKQEEKFMAVLGLRADHNNLYGNYFTPRLMLKYSANPSSHLHLQLGMGRRTPWVFVENLPLLISNRTLMIAGDGSKKAYGLNQEKAFNSGLSFTKNFVFLSQNSTFTADGFFTYFLNQIVADRDASPTQLIIRNEKGNQTWAGQAEWMFKPHRRLDVKMSYRYVNSRMFLGGQNRLQTLQSPHRILTTINYQTRKKWFFDWITQVNSPKRLPDTRNNPELLQMPSYTPWYTIVNLQMRKEWKQWEIYAGAENVLNVFQKNPVLSAADPSSPYFDAAFAWGPLIGRNYYAGIRWHWK